MQHVLSYSAASSRKAVPAFIEPHPQSLSTVTNALSILTNILQQQSITSKRPSRIPKLPEKLDIVQIPRNIIGTLIKHKVPSIILGYIHGVTSSHGPHLIIITPSHIRQAIPSRLDIRFIKWEFLRAQIHRVRRTNQQLSSIKSHPQSILDIATYKSHVLNTPGRSSVVRDPKVLTRFPRQEEVTTGGHGDVCSLGITLFVHNTSSEVGRSTHSTGRDTVERRIDRFLHLCFPVASCIFGSVHCSTARNHLCRVGTRGENSGGFSGKLGREGDAFPCLSSVLRVQQQGWLAEDPPLAVVETDHLETVGDFFFGVQVGEGARFPRGTSVVGLGEGSTSTDDVSVSGGVKVDIVHCVFEGDLHLTPLT
mmetsp:Transcript_5058/g.11188  ORF Transcript_5058/g.11188 Transcript_5058/m.11188 type:complete len:366 (+) Transcript_5058:73-1170(+)